MDSRFLMLVIFLLLFASMTMGFPTDGAEDAYQDETFFDDLTTFATGAWDNFFDLQSLAGQFAPPDNLDGAVASPGTPRRMYHYPSPNLATNLPYLYPHNAMDFPMLEAYDEVRGLNVLPTDENTLGRRPDLCPMNVEQLGQPGAYRNGEVQAWVDGAYALGDRNQTSPLPQTTQANPLQTQLPMALPPPIQHPPQPASQPSTPGASLGYLTCNHPGCDYWATRRCDMSHHVRCHLPAHRRPHQCSLCHRRFLFPRELRRHMSSHGIGTRHLCPIPRCRYASRGFGRRDHLLRHMRNCHATPSQTGTDATY